MYKRIENKELSFNGFAYREDRSKKKDDDMCIIYRSCIKFFDVGTLLEDEKILAIELVGNRFLRRMVRILLVVETINFAILINFNIIKCWILSGHSNQRIFAK